LETRSQEKNLPILEPGYSRELNPMLARCLTAVSELAPRQEANSSSLPTFPKEYVTVPKRLPKDEYEKYYSAITERDGEWCCNCKKAPEQLPHPLEIDHIDGNKDNWDIDNLRFLCKSDNVADGNRMRAARRRRAAESSATKQLDPSADNIYARAHPAASRVKELAEYSRGKPAMKANFLMEPKFRDYVLHHIVNHGSTTPEELEFAGAEYCGCQPRTAQNYLAKMTSSTGPLKIVEGDDGFPVVVARDGLASKVQDWEKSNDDE
jgi:5-methylcytosine-specific restriction endonuclease McrA